MPQQVPGVRIPLLLQQLLSTVNRAHRRPSVSTHLSFCRGDVGQWRI